MDHVVFVKDTLVTRGNGRECFQAITATLGCETTSGVVCRVEVMVECLTTINEVTKTTVRTQNQLAKKLVK